MRSADRGSPPVPLVPAAAETVTAARSARSLAQRARRLEQGAALVAACLAGAGVLIADWPPLLVLALFWVENLIVAADQSLRIFLVGARDGWVGVVGGALVAVIFATFALLLWFVHAGLIVSVVGDASLQSTVAMVDSAFALLDRVRAAAESWPLLGLMLLMALFDMIRWLAASRTDPMLEDLGGLMKAAVVRMTVLQGALLIGGFVLSFVQAPQVVVLLLIALKLGFDWNRLSGQSSSSGSNVARGAAWTH